MDPIEIGQDNGSQDIGQEGGNPTTGGVNPAWNDVLGIIPETLHSQITPHFQKWDQNFQTQIQKVHSQYEPWKPFIDNGVDPADVDYGLGLLNAIATNPQEVLSALQEALQSESGDLEQQGQNESTPGATNFDISQHPEFQKVQGLVDTMAELLLSQKEQEQQAQEDAALEQELETLREQHGEFDEETVLSLALKYDGDLEKAYQHYSQVFGSSQRQPGPPILGSGGSAPNFSLDPKKMDSVQTRQTVAQYLKDALGSGN